LLQQLLICSLAYGGLDNFIMTTRNIYLEFKGKGKDVKFHINYTSFAGLALIKAKQPIKAPEFM
jgi:hypothetical protein